MIKAEKKIQKQLLNREMPSRDIKVFSHEISKARQREEFKHDEELSRREEEQYEEQLRNTGAL